MKWIYLDEPFLASNYHLTDEFWHKHGKGIPKPPFEPPCWLLVEEPPDKVYSVVWGDWESISSDSGCGCCSGSRPEKILAWCPIEEPQE